MGHQQHCDATAYKKVEAGATFHERVEVKHIQKKMRQAQVRRYFEEACGFRCIWQEISFQMLDGSFAAPVEPEAVDPHTGPH